MIPSQPSSDLQESERYASSPASAGLGHGSVSKQVWRPRLLLVFMQEVSGSGLVAESSLLFLPEKELSHKHSLTGCDLLAPTCLRPVDLLRSCSNCIKPSVHELLSADTLNTASLAVAGRA